MSLHLRCALRRIRIGDKLRPWSDGTVPPRGALLAGLAGVVSLNPGPATATEGDAAEGVEMTLTQLADQAVDVSDSPRSPRQVGLSGGIRANALFHLEASFQASRLREKRAMLSSCSCEGDADCRVCDKGSPGGAGDIKNRWGSMHVVGRRPNSPSTGELTAEDGTIPLDSLEDNERGGSSMSVSWVYWKDIQDLPQVGLVGSSGSPLTIFRGRSRAALARGSSVDIAGPARDVTLWEMPWLEDPRFTPPPVDRGVIGVELASPREPGSDPSPRPPSSLGLEIRFPRLPHLGGPPTLGGVPGDLPGIFGAMGTNRRNALGVP